MASLVYKKPVSSWACVSAKQIIINGVLLQTWVKEILPVINKGIKLYTKKSNARKNETIT